MRHLLVSAGTVGFWVGLVLVAVCPLYFYVWHVVQRQRELFNQVPPGHKHFRLPYWSTMGPLMAAGAVVCIAGAAAYLVGSGS